jgi:hypothetical protein
MALATVLVSASQALTLAGSRAALGGNDNVDWGQFGPDGSTVVVPATANSTLGNTVTVSNAGGLSRFDAGSSWSGGFAVGDHLLYGGANVMTMEFGSLVAGAGMQLHSNFPGSPAMANIEAFDAMGSSLGDFDVMIGGGFGPNDDSAPFVGVMDSSASIKKLVYTVSGNSFEGFAGNDMDILTGDVVPEPASMIALALGAAAMIRRRRK